MYRRHRAAALSRLTEPSFCKMWGLATIASMWLRFSLHSSGVLLLFRSDCGVMSKSVRMGGTDVLSEGIAVGTGPLETSRSSWQMEAIRRECDEKRQAMANVTVAALPDLARRHRPGTVSNHHDRHLRPLPVPWSSTRQLQSVCLGGRAKRYLAESRIHSIDRRSRRSCRNSRRRSSERGCCGDTGGTTLNGNVYARSIQKHRGDSVARDPRHLPTGRECRS